MSAARENRAFLGRAVRYLAAECGIRRFLDLGAGLPTQGNVTRSRRRRPPTR
ncbi:SAM-dependent methyltransferase [Microbispora sp. NPDC046973]|uniref:SAM-dependent methyltransferase n=1 Tax=Microbispora sp. NPDC046973 TaxID=3155022 RepID=UPI0033DE6A17